MQKSNENENNTNTDIQDQMSTITKRLTSSPSKTYPTACIEESDATIDVESQLSLQRLESRVAKALRSSKGFTDLVEIAETYDHKVNIRLKTTPVSSNEFDALVTGIRKKDVAKIDTAFGVFEVPVPTSKAIPKYQKLLNNFAAASVKTLYDTSLLLSRKRVNIAKLAQHIQQVSKETVSKHVRTFDR